MVGLNISNIFATLSTDAISKTLLKGRRFVHFDGQLLFEQDGQLAITTIDNKNKTYTDEDYRQLPEGAPIQLVNGKLLIMSSPTDLHQLVSGNLFALLHAFNKINKLGKVRFAPLDVYLDTSNAFQPDLLFVSNKRKAIIQDFIQGAPDFVVEILSPGTKKIDQNEKLTVYGRNDVLEYWIIDPKKQDLFIYLNKNGKMKLHKKISKKGKVKATTIKGFSFQLTEIFED